jgi:lysophospholipase L1-like esterase
VLGARAVKNQRAITACAASVVKRILSGDAARSTDQSLPRTLHLAALLLVFGCSGLAPEPDREPRAAALGQAVASADHWLGTWAASPQSDGSTFSDKTLRQIVHTSIGGASVRIRLSNAFGNQPLSVDNLHIAERTSGSSIAPATDKSLLFGGQAKVSVAVGQSALSDPLVFEVKPLTDLVVSFHVQSSGNATAHQQGTQDNYVASGNLSDSATLPGAQIKGSYYFLSNVDVENALAWGAVVTLGASITDGVASSQNSNRRWPNDLAVRLNAAGIPVGVLNQGISGNKLLTDGAGESALKRFNRDVVAQPGVRWVIFSDDPINDLGSGNAPSGEQLIAGLKQLVASAHAAGIQFFCSTLTPFQGSGGWNPEGETARAAIHQFIRSADSGCDQIVDQDGATHDPAKPTWYLPAFDASDHLHPNEAGLQAIANAVNLLAFTAPPSNGGAGGAGGDATDTAGAPSSGGAPGGNIGAAGGSVAAAGGSAAAGAVSAGGASTAGGAPAAPGNTNAGSSGGSGAATSGASSAPANSSDAGCSCDLTQSKNRNPAPAWALLGLSSLLVLREQRRSKRVVRALRRSA